jgi:hypothetical protein
MIINVNGTSFDVKVLDKFVPTYSRAIKYEPMMNGSTYTSDRGVESDKYDTSITIIGDTEDMLLLVNDLILETNQITVSCNNEYIFGPALDYSTPFTCNVIGEPISFPVRDVLTTTISLKLRIVSQVVYDGTVSSSLPDIYYNLPVNRVTTLDRHTFNTISQGDFGVTTLIDNFSNPINRRECTFTALHTKEEMSQLQKFVSTQRDRIFTWTTNKVLSLFDNPTNPDASNVYEYGVKIKGFSFRPNGKLQWDSSITLIQD